ncbi:LysR family transcriptional regulator [Halovulum sp. GXIMD14794]
MDRLSVMKAYCRIVERGSFVRAAEDLGVSSALLSREVKLLEASLGCSLLSRTTRSMALTDHGRQYYEEARRLLAEIDAAEERVRQGAGSVQGRLRINAPQSFGQIVLGPALPGFLAAHPQVEVELSMDDRVIDMVEGGYDISIRVRAELPDSGLIARRLARVERRLFAAPAYLEARGTPASPDALRGHDTVSYLLVDQSAGWPLIGPEGEVAVPLTPRVTVGSSLVLRDLLISGQGIGALPDFISDPEERAGRLIRVLPDHAMSPRFVYAVTASRLGTDAKTLAFLDYLKGLLDAG